jgi:hypothetical protein
MSTRDSSNWIGRAKSSTSLTMRLSRATSSSMSVIASVAAAGETPAWRSECTADLMIINGFRTSCAMTVDRRPSAVSRSFCDISRWNRAIESVKVLNVVASSRASSSSQRLPWRGAILRVRSPVAATSRITSVIAASGWAIVRATAKLSNVASSTARTAVTISPAWIDCSDCSCAVRERRISATGPESAGALSPVEASGRGSASYSSSPSCSREMPADRSRSASSG